MVNWIFNAKAEIARDNQHAKDNVVRGKSLQMFADPRYREISQFTHWSQFTHQVDKEVHPPGSAAQGSAAGTEPKTGSVQALPSALPLSLSLEDEDTRLKQILGKQAPDHRVEMTRHFETSVKRLMVDFSLTEDAHCRTNHLERLHSWFANHGRKATKKAKTSPGFLTFDDLRPKTTAGVEAGANNNHDYYPPGSTFGFMGRRRPASTNVTHASLGVVVTNISSRPSTRDSAREAWGPGRR